MIQKKDLITGEYYVADNTNIFIWSITDSLFYLGNGCTTFSIGAGGFSDAERLATPKEKHWLLLCKEAKQFIEYETAMLSFIPYNAIIKDDPELSNILIKLLTQ